MMYRDNAQNNGAKTAAISPETDFAGLYRGRKVLVTGHTGFKGGWLCHWLTRLGAVVTGVALPPEPGPSLFHATGLGGQIDSRIADIRDAPGLTEIAGDVNADMVFHLAAQPFVRRSYRSPAETFATNVTGTAHVLDLARGMDALGAVVVITSDKCYENVDWVWGYRESDPMGGADPYSASKGCTELVAQSYRRSFFANPAGPQLASARAGNVFGGGDWGEDRLIPDIIRAQAKGQPVDIRAPQSIRPWQHVLEPLAGYLTLGAHLLRDGAAYAEGWNFGPAPSDAIPVGALTQMITRAWGEGAPQFILAPPDPHGTALHEATTLRLDSTKAQHGLGWAARWSLDQAIAATVDWYKAHIAGADMGALTQQQIDNYSHPVAGTDPARNPHMAAQ